MKIRRFSPFFPLPLLGAICLWLAPAAAHACDTDMVREYKPILSRIHNEMLYVIDDCKSPPSYLFGTIHLDDEQIKKSASPAFEALKKSQRSIFEMRSNQQSQQESIAMMIMPPMEKRTLSDIIGASAFRNLTNEIQKNQPGFPVAILERYRPWAASVLVQLPPPTADNIPLDDRLQIAAQKLSLPVIGLESPADQMAVFTQMTEKEQVSLLLDTLNNIDDLRDQNDQLRKLYVSGNLAGIEKLGDKAFNEIRDSKMRGYMRHSLITKRNEQMQIKMESYLKQGGSFIAVGALHLPGKSGLLNKLEEDGYFIWPVSAIAKH